MSDDEIPILVAGFVPASGELLFPDNRTGPCDTCGRLLQFRPHAPTPHVLRCIACTADQMLPGATVEVPPRMIEDARAWLNKRKN